MQYSVHTEDDDSFVFDITTGQIVSESRGARQLLWGGAIVILVVIVVAVVMIRRRRIAAHR